MHIDRQRKESFEKTGKELIDKIRLIESESRTEQDISDSWQSVGEQMKVRNFRSRQRFIWAASSVAASIIILFTIGFLFLQDKAEEGLSLELLSQTMEESESILLIAPDNEIELNNESSLVYESDGKLHVDDKRVKESEPVSNQAKIEDVNQIIVPKGKRAYITFSDGTKMHINSGSKVVYPAVFSKDKREILVEGEVFLEVSKDPSRPFIVKTNTMDVRVLGTEFNVCAYKEDGFASVVLVEGSVEVKSGEEPKTILMPNQMYNVNEKGALITEVNVEEYISWKENMMFVTDRKAGEVLNRLSRYYGHSIHYDATVAEIPISGKLDLRENLGETLDIICLSLSLNYSINENNDFIVTLK